MKLDLGPEVIRLLIPQRPPLLMLDRVSAVDLSASEPWLQGHRYLSANDPVFGGHFPELGVFPGVLTLEAVAQAAGALGTLLALVEAEPGALGELVNLERGATLDPAYDAERARGYRAGLRGPRGLNLGGAVNAKLVKPIFPGCRLDLRVWLIRRIDAMSQFGLEASVERDTVATGTISGSRVPLG
jgi:3-hydroxymyristoyl/3-hydroxydecanoyl-(acyl carrier protein) dehydratase